MENYCLSSHLKTKIRKLGVWEICFTDILSFESPLLPTTSLLKLCSHIIWLDYARALLELEQDILYSHKPTVDNI